MVANLCESIAGAATQRVGRGRFESTCCPDPSRGQAVVAAGRFAGVGGGSGGVAQVPDAMMAQADARTAPPVGTGSLRLGWRLTSSGTARVKELVLGWRGGPTTEDPGLSV